MVMEISCSGNYPYRLVKMQQELPDREIIGHSTPFPIKMPRTGNSKRGRCTTPQTTTMIQMVRLATGFRSGFTLLGTGVANVGRKRLTAIACVLSQRCA
jgi:hypothetical protein